MSHLEQCASSHSDTVRLASNTVRANYCEAVSAKPFSSVWTRERRGGREQGLSRDQIVRAAVELLDAEGLDALSMRKLGARLGAGATSLYWHVANKDELIELVMDEVYATVVLPEAADWREAARVFAYGMRHAVFEHPWSASLIGVVPALGPNALTASDRLMGAFVRAGFEGIERGLRHDGRRVVHAGRHDPRGRLPQLAEGVRQEHDGAAGHGGPDRDEDGGRPAQPAGRYRSYADEGFDPLVARRLAFEFGLTALLDGLGARLR